MVALPPSQRMRVFVVRRTSERNPPPKWYGLVNAVLAGANVTGALFAAAVGEWFGCATCLFAGVVAAAIAIDVQRKVW